MLDLGTTTLGLVFRSLEGSLQGNVRLRRQRREYERRGINPLFPVLILDLLYPPKSSDPANAGSWSDSP
jgi:hypothetical protein